MMFSYAVHESADNSNSYIVNTVVIVSIFREISFNFIVNNDIFSDINYIASLSLISISFLIGLTLAYLIAESESATTERPAIPVAK